MTETGNPETRWPQLLLSRLRELVGEVLLTQALYVLALRGVSACLMFTTTTLLARHLGPEGLGAFSATMALLILASLPLSFGIPQGIVRIVQSCLARDDEAAVAAAVRWSLVTGGTAAAAGALILLTLWAGASILGLTLPFHALAVALCLVPFVLIMCASGVLRAFSAPILAVLPDLIGRNGLLVIALGIFLAFDVVFEVGTILFSQALSIILGCAVALYLVHRTTRHLHGVKATAERSSEWRSICWPLLAAGIAGTVMTHADLVMLALIRGDDAAGLYRAASLAAVVATVVLAAFLHPLAPRVAAFAAQGKDEQLQRLVSFVTLCTTALTLPIAFALLISPEAILTLVFGDRFAPGAATLSILVIGQVVSVLCGPVAMVLQYSGSERRVAATFAACTGINILLNAALIPVFGAEGAAMATALSLVAWNVHLTLFASRHRNLSTSIFACGLLINAAPAPRSSS
ncbi:MAG: oligosaccharide flippase family protein [Geminicoccaceae bacterium]|nr:oligosaccharide flippase family protein [Geminicoccaceae bacterium]